MGELAKKHFCFNKQFITSALMIALPVALQNVISFGVNMMDSVMLGQLGSTAMSAANFGGKPFFLLIIIGFGLASGGSVLIAQYWGKGDIDKIRRVMALSMQFCMTVSVIFTVASIAFPHALVSLFTKDESIIEQGAQYLATLAFSYVFYSFSNCYLMCLRAIEKVKISTAIYGVSFFINVIFNYLFIFGKFGFPCLGVRGAAIGTIMARMSEFIMTVCYMRFKEKTINLRIKHMFGFYKELIGDYIKYSLPVVGNELLWGLGSIALSVIIGHISKAFTAANTIADVINQLTSVAAFGIANAAAVLTGKTIGAGKKETAQKMANTLILFAFIVGVIGCAAIIILRSPILSIYKLTAEEKQMAWDVLTSLAILQLALSVDLTIVVGILRGGGDTKTALAIDCGCQWAVAVPLGALAGLVLHWPAGITYFIMRSDTLLKTVVGTIRVLGGKWIRNITK